MFLSNRRMLFVNYSSMNKIVDEDPEQGTGALWLGDYGAATDKTLLKQKGVKTVITTASGLGVSYLPSDGITHRQYQLLDHESQNISHCFDSTYKEIEEGLKRGGVLVHCAAGISRSATCTIAYLMRKYNSSFRDTIHMVRCKRRVICPNLGFERQLKSFEQHLGLNQHNVKMTTQQAFNINANKSSYNKFGVQNNLNVLGNSKVNFYEENPVQGASSLTSTNGSNQKIQNQIQNSGQKRNPKLQPMPNRNMTDMLSSKLSQNNENLQVLGINKLLGNSISNTNQSQGNNNNQQGTINNQQGNQKNNKDNTQVNNNQKQNDITQDKLHQLTLMQSFAKSMYNNGPNIVTYNAKNNLRTTSRGPVPFNNNSQMQNKGVNNILTQNNFRKRSIKNMYQ